MRVPTPDDAEIAKEVELRRGTYLLTTKQFRVDFFNCFIGSQGCNDDIGPDISHLLSNETEDWIREVGEGVKSRFESSRVPV